MSDNQNSTLTPMHLRKAKLMFFWVRYPSSAILKMYFPDIKFNKNNTAQLVKWFSNFRWVIIFFIIQIFLKLTFCVFSHLYLNLGKEIIEDYCYWPRKTFRMSFSFQLNIKFPPEERFHRTGKSQESSNISNSFSLSFVCCLTSK